MNTSWGDTVKCLLDAGKAPYFDRKVRVRIYTYRSHNGFGISYVYTGYTYESTKGLSSMVHYRLAYGWSMSMTSDAFPHMTCFASHDISDVAKPVFNLYPMFGKQRLIL